MYFILIKNKKVDKTIVADEKFIELIRNEYDEILPISNTDYRPNPGDLYVDGKFVKPVSG